MKMYLAARYSRWREMQDIAAQLTALGHEIVSRWITGAHEMPDDHQKSDGGKGPALALRFAQEDIADLILADAVIHFTEAPGAPGRNRGGRHVEFGFAQAAGMIQVIVGPRENVFHHLPNVELYPTFSEFLTAIAGPVGDHPVTESLRNPKAA